MIKHIQQASNYCIGLLINILVGMNQLCCVTVISLAARGRWMDRSELGCCLQAQPDIYVTVDSVSLISTILVV
jgi:hypothetical protein